MMDGGLYDDKLICSRLPIPPWKKQLILLFFMIYAKAKCLINLSSRPRGAEHLRRLAGGRECPVPGNSSC